MALFKDLTRTIAEAEGVSEMTVTGIGQYLRDAGLISKLGRGRAAAQMTVDDAVNLLIAVNASDLAKNAVETVRAYRSLEVAPEPLREREDRVSKFITENNRTLAEALSAVIEALVPDSSGRSELGKHLEDSHGMIEIGFGRPVPAAFIRISRSGPRSPSNPFGGDEQWEDVAFAHYWNGQHLWSEHVGQRELKVFDHSVLNKIASVII